MPPSQRLRAAASLAALALGAALLLARPVTHLLDSGPHLLTLIGYAGFALSVLSLHIGAAAALACALAIVLRRRRLAACLAVPAVLGLAPFLWSLRPRDLPPVQPSDFRVLTLNALFENRDHQRIIACVRRHDPDLVCIEEYTAPLDSALRTALAATHPHVFALVRPNHRGQAIFSKHPLRNPRELDLAPGIWNAPALTATVDHPRARISLIAVHLPSVPSAEHLVLNYRSARAIADIARTHAASSEPAPPSADAASDALLLVGDFNFTPQTAQYALLAAAGMHEAVSTASIGRAVTHPVPGLPDTLNPGIQIDYIWCRGTARFTSSQTLEDVGSDHRPLLATLRLAAAPSTR